MASAGFVSVAVGDQDRALAFWTEKLGLRVATDQLVGPGKHWIKLRIPGAEAGLALFTPDGQEDRVGKFFNGSFTCDDVEQTYRKMSEKGVVFEGPPEKQLRGTFAKFRGPNRQHLRAVQPLRL